MTDIDAREYFIKVRDGKKYVDWPKLRGLMKNFAEDVDAIVGTEEEFDVDEVSAAFNRWAAEKIGGTWTMFLTNHVPKDDLYGKLREFYNDDEEFAELVESKYEYGADELEGNSDCDDGEEDDEIEEEETVDNPSSLDDWAKIQGTTDDPHPEVDEDDPSEVKTTPEDLQDYADRHGTTETIAMGVDRTLPRNEIMVGDCRDVMNSLPRNSVDCVITSPPYWDLRDYDGDNEVGWRDGWEGQLGHEPTPDQFCDHLMEVFDEIARVLKPTGSFWLNIDDTFCDSNRRTGGVQNKSLFCVPERLIVKMVENGWILRNKIAWVKRIVNMDGEVRGTSLPTPAKDRVMEKAWEYMYHFTISGDYYYDLENIAVEHKQSSLDAAENDNAVDSYIEQGTYGANALNTSNINDFGANIPNAWRINTASESADHFAPYPNDLCRRPIKATCPPDGVVMDPFTGSGTTLDTAARLGRDWVGIEISEEYAEIARQNISGKVEVTV